MARSQANLATEERLERLMHVLATEGSVVIATSALDLDVSEMTIRRDLIELEERGVARRVRGGAMALGPQTFAERKQSRSRAKAQIAVKLRPFIPVTGTVAFDASSTVMRAATALTGARGLTVLTNGPDTFHALQQRPGITPILTGGQLDARTGSLVGGIAAWSARQLKVSRFIASCTALDAASGATEVVLEEADVKRTIATGADEVILAVDSSKLERRATAVWVGWDTVDVLVTELDPDDPLLDPYRGLATII
jgi:DeoR family transcriptional regulator, fructose operon transcriptional repressor